MISDVIQFQIVTFGITVLFQIFLPCFFINEIEHLSGNFVNNLYESDWIGADRHRLQDLRILMETTKKPIVMKVAHIFTINMKTFLDVRYLELSQLC